MAVTLLGAPIAMAAVSRPNVESRRCPDGRASEPIIGGVAVAIVANPHEIDQVATEFPPAPTAPPFMDIARSYVDSHIEVSSDGLTVLSGVTANGDDRLLFLRGNVDAPKGSVLYVCARRVVTQLTAFQEALWAKPVTFEALEGTALPR
jgi:hypothetical protein